MCLVLQRTVADAPESERFAFPTGDDDGKRIFASRIVWTVVATSMCIGMVRNAIDHWWVRYMTVVFHKKPEEILGFAPYVVVTWGAPIVAVLGGIVSGNLSDRVFGSRRAPVVFFAFVGQAVALFVLSRVLHHAWWGAAMLLAITFFVQCTHVLIAGALSMDLGGKRSTATVAGLVDGAQYSPRASSRSGSASSSIASRTTSGRSPRFPSRSSERSFSRLSGGGGDACARANRIDTVATFAFVPVTRSCARMDWASVFGARLATPMGASPPRAAKAPAPTPMTINAHPTATLAQTRRSFDGSNGGGGATFASTAHAGGV